MQVAYNNQEEFSAFSACREQLENMALSQNLWVNN